MAAALAVVVGAASPSFAATEATPITDETNDLAAGTWVDTSSGPTIEFTVEDGWYMDAPPLPGVGVALAHSAFEGAYATIVHFDGRVFDGPCATAENAAAFFEGPGIEIEASAESFADHLDGHPYVSVSAVTPVAVGGFSGFQVDMRSEVPADCDPPWAWLWQLPDVGDFHLNDAEDARFIALDVDDHVTVIALEAFTGPDLDAPAVDWDGFLEVAGGVLDSMVITPAE